MEQICIPNKALVFECLTLVSARDIVDCPAQLPKAFYPEAVYR